MKNEISCMLSVIIPVFNMEKYLSDCIDSVLRQTVEDIEVILVDDGSSDDSGAICDKYAVSDGRVRVLHQVNGGASFARLQGVENSEGEWIGFVDADDIITPTYYNDLLKGSNRERSLLVCSSNEDVSFSHDDFIKGLMHNRIDWRMPSKLYHRSLLNKDVLGVPKKIYIGEDLIVNLRIAHYLDKVSMVKTEGYYYRDNMASITHKREWSLEYENYFLKCVEVALGNEKDRFEDELWRLQMNAWKNLVVNGSFVNFDGEWVANIKSRSNGKVTTIGDKVLLLCPNFQMAYILMRGLIVVKKFFRIK